MADSATSSGEGSVKGKVEHLARIEGVVEQLHDMMREARSCCDVTELSHVTGLSKVRVRQVVDTLGVDAVIEAIGLLAPGEVVSFGTLSQLLTGNGKSSMGLAQVVKWRDVPARMAARVVGLKTMRRGEVVLDEDAFMSHDNFFDHNRFAALQAEGVPCHRKGNLVYVPVSALVDVETLKSRMD